GLELMRQRRRLNRTLQQQAVESRADRVRAMLEVDLELSWSRLLHHRVDRKPLNLADPVNVVDERRQRIYLVEAERERPARIVGEAIRCLEHEGAISSLFRHIEFELDRHIGDLPSARETFDLGLQQAARVDIFTSLDRHHGLRMPAVAHWD